MKLEKNEYTTKTLIEFLTKKYEEKTTGEEFNSSDIAQYLRRGMTPYRYGGFKLSSKKEKGIRIITLIK